MCSPPISMLKCLRLYYYVTEIIENTESTMLFFNQSEAKPKPIANWLTRVFPRYLLVLCFWYKLWLVDWAILARCDWPDVQDNSNTTRTLRLIQYLLLKLKQRYSLTIHYQRTSKLFYYYFKFTCSVYKYIPEGDCLWNQRSKGPTVNILWTALRENNNNTFFSTWNLKKFD